MVITRLPFQFSSKIQIKKENLTVLACLNLHSILLHNLRILRRCRSTTLFADVAVDVLYPVHGKVKKPTSRVAPALFIYIGRPQRTGCNTPTMLLDDWLNPAP